MDTEITALKGGVSDKDSHITALKGGVSDRVSHITALNGGVGDAVPFRNRHRYMVNDLFLHVNTWTGDVDVAVYMNEITNE